MTQLPLDSIWCGKCERRRVTASRRGRPLVRFATDLRLLSRVQLDSIWCDKCKWVRTTTRCRATLMAESLHWWLLRYICLLIMLPINNQARLLVQLQTIEIHISWWKKFSWEIVAYKSSKESSIVEHSSVGVPATAMFSIKLPSPPSLTEAASLLHSTPKSGVFETLGHCHLAVGTVVGLTCS